MVKILADSTCDLSPSLISRYKIGIIPLYVHLGEKEYKDGVDITPSDLYKWSDEHNETPRTSAPGIEDIESFLDKDSADEYVIFTISSSMSSSYKHPGRGRPGNDRPGACHRFCKSLHRDRPAGDQGR